MTIISAVLLLVTACDPNGTPTEPQVPVGAVRLQGAFDNLVPAETVVEARATEQTADAATSREPGGSLNPRSLISQSASICAILAGLSSSNLDDPGAVTTTEVQPEGGFTVDVDTAAAPDGASGDYVMLAYDESLGVGVEHLIGFIELPAGADESSAGWPLGGAVQGATLDLGTMSGDGGAEQSIVAASDQNELYEALGADQAAVLFQAQRDNFFLNSQNTYLNRDGPPILEFANNLNGDGNLVQDAWTGGADFETLATPSYELIVSIAEGFPDLAQQLENRTIDLAIVPPETVDGLETGTAGPGDPITVADEDQSAPDPTSLRFVLSGTPPQGVWPVSIAGEPVAAYDFALASYFNQEGRLQYYVPEVRLLVADNGLVETVEIRWTYYDPVQDSYEIVQDVTDTLPLFNTGWQLDLKADTTEITIVDSVVGTPATVSTPIYFPPSPGGELELSAVVIRTDVAGIYTSSRSSSEHADAEASGRFLCELNAPAATGARSATGATAGIVTALAVTLAVAPTSRSTTVRVDAVQW